MAAQVQSDAAIGEGDPVVNTRRSFIRFLYPILFDPETFELRAAAAQGATWGTVPREVPVWEPESFQVHDLLKHVADYLSADLNASATAVRWRLTNDARQSPAGLANADWRLVVNARQQQPTMIPFVFDAVELTLFSTGVGFLTLCVQPSVDTAPSWTDVLHAFRFVRGQRGVAIRAKRPQASDPEAPFYPIFAGGSERLADGNGMVGDLLTGLLHTVSLESDPGMWWEEVFVPGQLLPFAGLMVRNIEQPALELLVYQVRNFFGSRQTLYPTATDLALADHPGILPYVKNSWFTFSLDGGAFVAGDLPSTPFFRDQLPEHLHTRYYLLYLLVLHQRFALVRLSGKVADVWVSNPSQEDEVSQELAMSRIRRDLLLFTARGYFAQIMQEEHHHAAYRRWQETLQIERLYREVRDEVREVYQHVIERQTRRLTELQEQAARREQEAEHHARNREAFLGILAGLLGGPALTLSFLSAVGPVNVITAVIGTLVGLVVGTVIVALSLLWLRRK